MCLDLGQVGGVHHVRHGVVINRMAKAELERQNGDLILLVIVCRQLDLAVEYGQHAVVGLLWNGVGAVALQAQSVARGAQQVVVVAAMRSVAGGAAEAENRLVVNGLLAFIGHVGMATQANAYRVGLGQAGLVAGMRTVTIGAVASRPGMRHLGVVDQLGLVVVAGYTQRLDVRLCKHHFAVFGRCMARIAAARLKWSVLELRHQLGLVRLVRIVALNTVGRAEGLIVMRLLQVGILGIVAVNAQCGCRLGEVELVVNGRFRAGFVCQVAGIAAHVERGMAAAAGRHVHAGGVASEAKIVFSVTRLRLQQLVLVVAGMRIVAGEAVSNSGRMNRAFYL